jgi:mono/diheme cytochrome c family protein
MMAGLAAALLCVAVALAADAPKLELSETRHAASDLEVGGELAGVPAGSTRYVTLDALLALPLETYTVNDDPDFAKGTKVSGVPLEKLAQTIGAGANSDLVVAICDDKYRANYPRAYIAAHHPQLVLRVNGEPPGRWPKDPETHKYDMGPYMISHPKFAPSFRVLSHSDEAQIPWGVVRLEFRDEKTVMGAITPRGSHSKDEAVQQGYLIAQQNCYRCHNAGSEGGQKSGRPWLVLAAWANADPAYFESYVRDPKKMNKNAEMPGNRGYDQATVRALREYFATFVVPEKP